MAVSVNSTDIEARDQRAWRTDSKASTGKAPVSMTSVSWTAEQDLSFALWIEHGRRLGMMGRGAAWWIGDWLRHGSARYGERYALGAKVTGYDDQTLMNMVYVASRFETSRRREKLSWSHHAELASLPPDNQDHWLDRAIAERLTIRALRDELAVARRRPPSTLGHPRRDSLAADTVAETAGRHADPSVSRACPQCGFVFRHDAGDDAAT